MFLFFFLRYYNMLLYTQTKLIFIRYIFFNFFIWNILRVIYRLLKLIYAS